jgi:protein TonB
VLIHAALFALLLGAGRLLPASSGPIAFDISILANATGSQRNEVRKKTEHRHPTTPSEKPAVKQQEASSETAVAEKAVAKQEQATPETTATNATKESELGSDTKGADVVGPVFNADYLHNPKPVYPPIARRMKLEGTVIVHVLVSVAGKPDIVRLGKSSGAALLDQAALAVVQGWSFIPARQGNKAIPAWVDIPIRFHLV